MLSKENEAFKSNVDKKKELKKYQQRMMRRGKTQIMAEGMQKQAKKLMQETLHVGQGQEYHTIQSAIDDAEDYSTIEIEQGIYQENLRIMKPGLKIKQVDLAKLNPNEDVILIAEQGPAIFIDIGKEERLQISGLKISNQGEKQMDQNAVFFKNIPFNLIVKRKAYIIVKREISIQGKRCWKYSSL